MPGTVVKPKSDGTAVATILDVDDPFSLISKDFTGGVVIVEVGQKKLCNYGRDVCYKTMVHGELSPSSFSSRNTWYL